MSLKLQEMCFRLEDSLWSHSRLEINGLPFNATEYQFAMSSPDSSLTLGNTGVGYI